MKSKFKMPTAYTVLFIIIIVMAILTWVIPPGQYDYVESDGSSNEPIAGTYHEVEPNQQGIADVLLSPFEGFYNAVDIAVFILMVGGFLGVVMKTGAINAGISNVINKLKGKEKYMIAILMTLFGLGGTTYGMAEETIAFYPLLIPVFIAAGYDALSAVAVILLGAGVGVLGSTVNPFATGIASGFAGISLGDGIIIRIIQFVVLEAIAIFFVTRYAEKVRKDPSKSYVADMYENNKSHFSIKATNVDDLKLTGKRKITLIIFSLVFVVMIYSVIPFSDLGITAIPTLAWWFQELAALFLVGAVVIGIFARLSEEDLISSFVAGSADLLGVAFIIGISRGITVIMNNGLITDTILYWGEQTLSGAGSIIFIALTYIFYIPLSFLIPSTSGLATLSMPIMSPLADFANVGRDLVITAFQSASGLVNLITPTSAVVMGGLAIGRVPYDKWIKYVWKFVLLLFILTLIILILAVLI
ncbi:YfcC family protein [Sedimentibacter sp. zth1]|uniref:YfcC family protein n=1 Tax=Sedimentibacter sp. zth1 TaxID=2816908 RepID=UPI001A931AF0|nr:YfcC family protein [Sedimentibacter sp. zth1]QSX05414.1 YfcC family protein [Sedimentibacter sp. zth1]